MCIMVTHIFFIPCSFFKVSAERSFLKVSNKGRLEKFRAVIKPPYCSIWKAKQLLYTQDEKRPRDLSTPLGRRGGRRKMKGMTSLAGTLERGTIALTASSAQACFLTFAFFFRWVFGQSFRLTKFKPVPFCSISLVLLAPCIKDSATACRAPVSSCNRNIDTTRRFHHFRKEKRRHIRIQ